MVIQILDYATECIEPAEERESIRRLPLIKHVVEPESELPGKKEQGKKAEEKPFAIEGLKLNIPKGAFVAIVGRVGSGKVRLASRVRAERRGAHAVWLNSQSSLLQSLIGEMRKTRGECVFSSTAAYVPQTAWIMNATLRQNVIFGEEEDESK